MHFDDTIIAPATIPGTGAISVVRISGPDAMHVTDSLVAFRSGNASTTSGGRVKYGTVSYSGEPLDEVLVSVFKAPHSYTGEDSVEIMCHASSYIVSTILEMAVTLGCRMAGPGEFTQRAFINGKMDLTQAEAVADVISSSDAASHKIAFKQLKGGISEELASLRARLLEMTSLLELELDFSEEDVEFADRNKLLHLLDEAYDKMVRLVSSFKLGNAIKNGVPVAIAGPANAGKSTLLNRILGEDRAIVSEIAGTTRDTVEECFNVNGIQFRFVDTAGIRETEGTIEKLGIERSIRSISTADIVIAVADVTNPEPFLNVLTTLSDTMDFGAQKLIIALNKVDLEEKKGTNIFVNTKNNIVSLINNKGIDKYGIEFVAISAKNGGGVGNLLEILSSHEKNRLDSATSSNAVLITNLRHYEALTSAMSLIPMVRNSLLSGVSSELISEDLRAVLATLSSITGEISTDEVLGEIFGKFCIGK